MALRYWQDGEPIKSGSSDGALDYWYNGDPLGFLLGALQSLSPNGIASEEAFGTAVVAGPITCTGIASLEAFGSHTVDLNDQFLYPTGIASLEAFGSHTVFLVNQTTTPGGIASLEAFGTPVVAGPITLTTGITSLESFGTPVVAGPITCTGITSEEAFGTAYCNVAQTLTVTGITSEEAFGTAVVKHVITLTPTGITSLEAFGTPEVEGGPQGIIILGGIYQGGMGIPTLTGGVQNLQIFIGNYDRAAGNYIEQTLKITYQTLGRANAAFTLYDDTGTWAPSLGMKVLCKEFGRTLFTGCLHTIRADRVMSTESKIFYHCTAVDKSSILNRRVVKKTYQAEEDAADVVRDIALNFLDNEGLTTDGVPESLGVLGTTLVLNLVSVAAAYDQIYNIVAAQWWVDVYGTVHFKSLAEAPDAPISLTETSRNWRNLTVESTLEDYRNKQYVKTNLNVLPGSASDPGNTGAPSRTESWTVQQPYAAQQGFITGAGKLQYNVIRVTSVRVNGVEEPFCNFVDFGLGDFGYQVDLGMLWGYFPGSPYIIAPGNSSGTSPFPAPPEESEIPIIGDVVEIDYIPDGYTSSVQEEEVLVPDPPSGVFNPPGTDLGTCGSGVYEFVDQVTDIQYQDDLDAIAAGILARSGGIPFKLQFETDQPNLMPGQKMSVHIPNMLLEEVGGPTDVFITQVSGGAMAGNLGDNVGNPGPFTTFRWNIVASNRRDYGDYVKWYQRLVTRSNLALPINQYEEATFVIGPGSNISSGTNLTNPYIVGRSGRLVECLIVAGVAPVDQNLVIDITKSDGTSIFNAGSLPEAEDGVEDLQRYTTFASDPLYLSKDEVLRIAASYSVVGGTPTAASSVTVKLRWVI